MEENEKLDIKHIPVLLPEVMHFLKINENGLYVDGTLGSGGHTIAMLKKGARVIAIDQDEDAIARAKRRIRRELGDIPDRFKVVHENHENIDVVLDALGIKAIDGILLDLGVSSEQLDYPERGFSFRFDAPLDMRMDASLKVTAADLINGLTKDELVELFVTYGEVYKPLKIASAIVRARVEKRIDTTQELANIIAKAYRRGWNRKIHPATQVFQALRIAVNNEYRSLERVLNVSINYLKIGARIAVISFHSIEDRQVKVAFSENELLLPITRKPVVAGQDEMEANPRARSAKLRVAERIKRG